MAFTVRYRNLDLVFDSLAEIDGFADQVEARKTVPKAKANEVHRQNGNGVSKGQTSVGEIVKTMNERQGLLLAHLAGADNSTMRDSELREALGLKSNQQLAGLIGGISKRMKASGFSVDAVIQSEKLIDDGEKFYRYTIPSKVVDDVTNNLPG